MRKSSSSLDLARLLALSSTRRRLPVNCSSHTPAPCCKHPTTVAAPIIPFISRGHMIKQKRWALVKATVALAKASSRCDCFSSGESSWKLYPRPPVRKPIFVCARSTCCAVIPAHDVTPLEITFSWPQWIFGDRPEFDDGHQAKAPGNCAVDGQWLLFRPNSHTVDSHRTVLARTLMAKPATASNDDLFGAKYIMAMGCGDIKSGTACGLILQGHEPYQPSKFPFNPCRKRESNDVFCEGL